MKNIIMKIIGTVLILFSLLLIIGIVALWTDGEFIFSEDWYSIIIVLIFIGLGFSSFKAGMTKTFINLSSNSVVNEKMHSSIDNIGTEIEQFDAQYEFEKSSNIYVGEKITDDCLKLHKKLHKSLFKDEKVLLILNSKKSLIASLFPFTGFVLTDKNFYFATLTRSFITGIIPLREQTSSVPLLKISSFQIGEHDTCFGTTYIGHDLMINGKILGLVRLGYNMIYDGKALNYINKLSQHLFDKGFLLEKPQEFTWQ